MTRTHTCAPGLRLKTQKKIEKKSKKLENIEKIEKYTESINVHEFVENELIQDGVIRNFEIIIPQAVFDELQSQASKKKE